MCLISVAGYPESTAAKVAPASAPSVRDALHKQAQSLQGGDLADLLMAWFDAGYQLGKYECK